MNDKDERDEQNLSDAIVAGVKKRIQPIFDAAVQRERDKQERLKREVRDE